MNNLFGELNKNTYTCNANRLLLGYKPCKTMLNITPVEFLNRACFGVALFIGLIT